ncbi:hypothetical protein LMG28138_02873 [Pararobbsia alpina]|uniref:Uncharacterized protein n=1 Tax=Pararobbsia alpina TaxID=621374 RepID=A0A6S7B7I3_9BURK|nr:hypothetical protein LMG28138_02873 [Pararobbsia alpina]
MTTIRITGWKAGFNKVQFGSLLRECCGFSLSERKRQVDSILQGDVITIEIAPDRCEHFLQSASYLGAICELGANSDRC